MQKSIWLLMVLLLCGCVSVSDATVYVSPTSVPTQQARIPIASAVPTPEPAAVQTSAPSAVSTPEPEPIPFHVTFAFGGDVCMEYGFGTNMKNGKWDEVLDSAVAARFAAADFAVVNLETAVSLRGKPEDKEYTFCTEPQNLAYLRDRLGVDLVTLANNHSMDYGVDAFVDTLDHLDEYGIAHVGGGRNLAEASAPHIIELQGRRIAIIGASQVAPTVLWYATDDRPGHLMAYDTSLVNAAITAAKETCDFVIVYIHWGTELAPAPKQAQVSAAYAMIDAGADAIVGSHPHVVQTFEIYNGNPILYSLGNFLFNAKQPASAVAFLHLTDDGFRVEVVPLVLSGGSAMRPAPEKARALLDEWEAYSGRFGFDADGFLTPVPNRPPKATPGAKPTPTLEPTPEPTLEPLPASTLEPTPEPLPASSPSPTLEPTPEPLPVPTPGPDADLYTPAA